MKQLLQKAKAKTALVASTISAGVASILPVHASGFDVGSFNAAGISASPDKIVNKLAGLVLTMARYVGIVLTIWGFVMLAMSFKNEEPESKQKAIMLLIGGIFLIGIEAIAKAVLLKA